MWWPLALTNVANMLSKGVGGKTPQKSIPPEIKYKVNFLSIIKRYGSTV